jgi:hypothetical protein
MADVHLFFIRSSRRQNTSPSIDEVNNAIPISGDVLPCYHLYCLLCHYPSQKSSNVWKVSSWRANAMFTVSTCRRRKGKSYISPTASEISFSPSSVLGIKEAICSRSSLSVGPPVCLGGDDRHASSAKNARCVAVSRVRLPRCVPKYLRSCHLPESYGVGLTEFLWCSV